MMGVSGGVSSLINRLRFGPIEETELSQQELVEAMRQATVDAFGDAAIENRPEVEALASGSEGSVVLNTTARRTPSTHAVLLGGLVAGGLASVAIAGSFAPTLGLTGELFPALVGRGGWAGPLVLLAGGMLVGFGTRMAGGCTSGHGLCGVSRIQPGSIVATAAFFGSGVVVSFLLRGLL
jgi:hypothetical protein